MGDEKTVEEILSQEVAVSDEAPSELVYGFLYEHDGGAYYTGTQGDFQRYTHQAVLTVSAAIEKNSPWSSQIKNSIEYLAAKRYQVALLKCSDPSAVSLFGLHLSTEMTFTTGLINGTRDGYREQLKRKLCKPAFRWSLLEGLPPKETYRFLPLGLSVWSSDLQRWAICCTPPSQKTVPFFCYRASSGEKIVLSCAAQHYGRGYWSTSDQKRLAYILSQLPSDSLVYEKDQIDTFIQILHCPDMCDSKRDLIYKELQIIYAEFIDKLRANDSSLITKIAKIHWLYVQASLHTRGSGWIPEALACALMKVAKIPFHKWKVESWSEAMTSTVEEFCENYTTFFE